jgi:hypothetical protein
LKFSEHDHKFAKLILSEIYPEIKEEIRGIITALNIPLGRGYKTTPSKVLQKEFERKGWVYEASVGQTELQFDCLKEKVAIEIETTDPGDIINDFLKFQIAALSNQIDVGVLIVYDDSIKGKNIPHVKDVEKRLEAFSVLIQVPIWVIGLKH